VTRIGVVVFPGSNCEYDALGAVSALGAEAEFVWHSATHLDGFDGVILPGGFAHGDYLRPGALARFSPVMEAVAEFARAGGAVLGICNGFQVLTEAGLLPGAHLPVSTNDADRRIHRVGTHQRRLSGPGVGHSHKPLFGLLHV